MWKIDFNKNELYVLYHSVNIENELKNYEDLASYSKNINKEYLAYYRIIYVKKGDFSIVNGLKISKLKENSIAFAQPYTQLYLKENHKNLFEYFVICFYQQFFI